MLRGIKPPKYPLYLQVSRDPGLKKGDCPLEVFTPVLHRKVKAVKVVGKPWAAIRANMIEVETRASEPLDVKLKYSIPIQCLRLRKNRRKENEEEINPFRLRTPKGHEVRVWEALGKTLPELEELFYKIDNVYTRTYEPEIVKRPTSLERLAARNRILRASLLVHFGKVGEIITDRKRKVLRLEASKLVERLKDRGIKLEDILNRGPDFATNDRGMLTNLIREEVETLIAELNKEFRLGIGLPDQKTGELIAKELTNELLADLIFSFYNQIDLTTLGDTVIKNIDPIVYPHFMGVVAIEV